MADRSRGWWRAQSLLERWPAFANGTGPERGRIVGGLVGLLTGMVLGFILGMLNRQLAGALVGALSAGIVAMIVGALAGWAVPRRKVSLRAEIEVEGTRDAFAPGDALNGFVVLHSDGSVLVHEVTVALSCQGSFAQEKRQRDPGQVPVYGRKTTLYWQDRTAPVQKVRLHKGSVVRFPFSLVLPEDALPTYRGFGCRVIWMLQADVNAQRPVAAVQQEVTVASLPSTGMSDSSQASVTCDRFTLALTLPQLQYAEGDALQGQVTISPIGDATLSELRVALVRVERLAEGDGRAIYFADGDPERSEVLPNANPDGQGTTFVWLERHETLDEDARFQATRGRRYPFTMPLTHAWRPTISTPEGVVHWQLSAVVSRDGLPDVQASLRLAIHTSEPWVSRVVPT